MVVSNAASRQEHKVAIALVQISAISLVTVILSTGTERGINRADFVLLLHYPSMQVHQATDRVVEQAI